MGSIDSPLTPRETEVLEALSWGGGTKVAAESLGMAYHTARTHRQNILLKLHVHDAEEAIGMALRKGWIR